MKLAPLILAATLTTAGSAMADISSADTTRTVTVEIEYDRSLLASPAGAQETYDTVRQQARKACRYKSYYQVYRTDFDCLYDLVDQAVAKIGHRELSALHDSMSDGAALAQR